MMDVSEATQGLLDAPDRTAPTPRRTALVLREVAVGYEAVEIIGGISLALRSADCWLLRGPNGSGKTTLLKTLAGLIPLVRGTIEATPGLSLTYVPAEDSLSPTLPLRLDEVALMGACRLYPAGFAYPHAIRQRAKDLLKRLGLWHKRRQAFIRSSSGERQRTLLARALLGAPDILLMDEPTSNLDQDSLAYFMEMLRGLHCEGVGMLISTHVHGQFASLQPRFLEVRGHRLSEAAA